ncbi:MAG: FAD binding domain-containing protein, partial [Alphaproteobacteria bacterium]
RLFPRVAHHIAHLPIRMRGTFGGSLAHADPSSEWCLLARSFDATMAVRSAAGERRIAAADWFEAALTTALDEGEALVSVVLPALGRHEVLVVDDRAWKEVARIPTAGQPGFAVARPDGRQVW